VKSPSFFEAARKPSRIALIVVLLITLISCATALRWGLPQAVDTETVQPWALDTIAPIAPLNEAYHRFTRAGNEFVVYPLLHYIVLAGVYAPYVGWQFIDGDLDDPSSIFPYGIADVTAFCQDLTVLARLVSLAMALGIVLLIHRITLAVASPPAALLAALAASLFAPLAYYGKTSNLDVPYAFWVMLGVWQCLAILRDGRVRNYVLLGAFAAFAVATKDQAYGFFVLVPFFLAWADARRDSSTFSARRWLAALFSPPMLAGGVAAVLAYAAANNLFFGGLDGLMRHLSYGGELYDYREQSEDSFYAIGNQLELLGESTLILIQTLGPATAALALGGIVLAFRERRFELLFLLVFFVSYYLSVIVVFSLVFARYLLVPALLLLPFAGLAGARLLAARGRRAAAGGWLVVGAALLGQLLLVVNLNLTLIADSRYAMEDWIRANVAEGRTIESPVRKRLLPRVADAYDVRVVGNSGDSITGLAVPEELTATALAKRSPDYILVLEGLGVTGDPAGWEQPVLLAYYEALLAGDLGYRIVADFETPHFLPFRQIPGTRPRSILLARDDLSKDHRVSRNDGSAGTISPDISRSADRVADSAPGAASSTY
jgi:4-amino-4-deoxy-L-arabinose transferase-like glycosyltransferase